MFRDGEKRKNVVFKDHENVNEKHSDLKFDQNVIFEKITKQQDLEINFDSCNGCKMMNLLLEQEEELLYLADIP